jgi:hypothetical protein
LDALLGEEAGDRIEVPQAATDELNDILAANAAPAPAGELELESAPEAAGAAELAAAEEAGELPAVPDLEAGEAVGDLGGEIEPAGDDLEADLSGLAASDPTPASGGAANGDSGDGLADLSPAGAAPELAADPDPLAGLTADAGAGDPLGLADDPLTGADALTAGDPLAAIDADPLGGNDADPLAEIDADPLAASDADPLAAIEAEPPDGSADATEAPDPVAASSTPAVDEEPDPLAGVQTGGDAPGLLQAASLNHALLATSLATDAFDAVRKAAEPLAAAGLTRGLLIALENGAPRPLAAWEKTGAGASARKDGLAPFLTPGLNVALARLIPGWTPFGDDVRADNLKPFARWVDREHKLMAASVPIGSGKQLAVIVSWHDATRNDGVLKSAALEVLRKIAPKAK